MVIEERFSLRTSLLILVLACVGPLAVLSGVLLVRQDQQQRIQVEARTQLLADKVLADLEREMAGVEAALRVLSTSRSLQTGNLRAFHDEASRAVRSGVVSNYMLTDAEGRQLVNTLVPFGQALPSSGHPAQRPSAPVQPTAMLTDLYVGPVTREPTTAMGVPVEVDGEVRYRLNMGLTWQSLSAMLARQPLPAEWLVAVLDRQGVIVARSRDAARFVGMPAVPELVRAVKEGREGRLHILTRDGVPVSTSLTRSERWGWSVAVGAPEHLHLGRHRPRPRGGLAPHAAGAVHRARAQLRSPRLAAGRTASTAARPAARSRCRGRGHAKCRGRDGRSDLHGPA